MFLYVLNEQDKIKIESEGYKFICKNKLNNKEIYIFEDNNKLKFNKDIKVFRTNRLYF